MGKVNSFEQGKGLMSLGKSRLNKSASLNKVVLTKTLVNRVNEKGKTHYLNKSLGETVPKTDPKGVRMGTRGQSYCLRRIANPAFKEATPHKFAPYLPKYVYKQLEFFNKPNHSRKKLKPLKRRPIDFP